VALKQPESPSHFVASTRYVALTETTPHPGPPTPNRSRDEALLSLRHCAPANFIQPSGVMSCARLASRLRRTTRRVTWARRHNARIIGRTIERLPSSQEQSPIGRDAFGAWPIRKVLLLSRDKRDRNISLPARLRLDTTKGETYGDRVQGARQPHWKRQG
jgi:hypothetical protein